jgi:alpha-glucosidase
MLCARRRSPALCRGDLELLDGPVDTLLYRRRADADERLVAIHFGRGAARIPLGGEHVVEVSSDGTGEGAPFDGTLSGDRAVVLRPT